MAAQRCFKRRPQTRLEARTGGRLLERQHPVAQCPGPVGGDAAGGHPIDGEWLVDAPGPRPREDEPDQQVPVLGRVQLLVEPPDGTHPRPAQCTVVREAPFEDRPRLIGNFEWVRGAVEVSPPRAVDLEVDIRRQHVEVGSCCAELTERLESFGKEDVIGVEDGDELARRGSGSQIARRRRPAVLLAQQLQSACVRAQRSLDVVGRAVVADDHLQRRDRLAERRVDRFPDRLGGVVGGDHDREGGGPVGSHRADGLGSEDGSHGARRDARLCVR